jgi:Zn-dependent M28 family amino/carboxypeptidase
MLGLAEALAMAPPKRSVLFLATTAEEQGLLGAEWWTNHPTVPLAQAVADVNLDPMNVEALVDDIVPLGAERSTLEAVVAAVAKERKLAVMPDPRPEQGIFYRSDHFPFARKGIPAISLKTGTKYRGKPATWAEERFTAFNKQRYHQPSDQVTDSFDWAALAQHAEIAHAIVLRIANASDRPRLDADDEFALSKAAP